MTFHFITTLMLLAGALGARAEAPAAEDLRVRVLSYNTHHGEGTDGVLDLARIAGVIRAAEAEVVCLQEIDLNQARSGRVAQAQVLAEMLDMAYVFESNYDFGGGGYGNAVLTRLPIVGHENTPLPNPNGAEPRGALRVALRLGAFEFDVICTHLGLKPDERAAQAAALLELLRAGRPALLAGDLNEDETAAGVASLLTRLDSVHGLFDPAHPFTSSAANPRRRIDFVLYTAPFRADNAGVVRAPPVAVASDHLPVLAEFRVPGPAGISSPISKE